MTLLTLTLYVQPNSNPPSHWTGRHVQAWFLNWLRAHDPVLAAQLHDHNGRKPYAVSPLFMQSVENGVPFLRITTLTADLGERLATFLQEPPRSIQLGALIFQVDSIAVHRSSYETLIREATEQVTPLALHFVTAATFRSQQMDMPLPLPPLVFGSLIHAWDMFSPLPLPILLQPFIDTHLAIAQCELRTRRVTSSGRETRIGFTGSVRYMVRDTLHDPPTMHESRVLIGALVRYAAFAGVGAQTSAGMGQVHVIS